MFPTPFCTKYHDKVPLGGTYPIPPILFTHCIINLHPIPEVATSVDELVVIGVILVNILRGFIREDERNGKIVAMVDDRATRAGGGTYVSRIDFRDRRKLFESFVQGLPGFIVVLFFKPKKYGMYKHGVEIGKV